MRTRYGWAVVGRKTRRIIAWPDREDANQLEIHSHEADADWSAQQWLEVGVKCKVVRVKIERAKRA